jgi:hypothetical protein
MIIDVVEASLLLDYLLSDPTLASIISAGGSFFRLEAICRWFIGCMGAYMKNIKKERTKKKLCNRGRYYSQS